MPRVKNVAYIKMNNIIYVVREILRNKRISKSQIAKSLGVSSATVSQILTPLMKKKMILNVGKDRKTKSGRTPQLLSLNPDYGYILTADLSDYESQIALVDISGRIIVKRSFLLGKGRKFLKDLKNLFIDLQKLPEELEIPYEKIIGIGLGVSGVYNKQSKRIFASIIPECNGLRLTAVLEDSVRLPVYIINDASASALIEFVNMKKHVRNLFLVYMGRGIGSGIILNDKIYFGERGYSGEIGALPRDLQSGERIEKLYGEILDSLNGKNEEKAYQMVERILRFLILSAVSILDIETVVVSGKLQSIPQDILIRVEKYIRDSFYGLEIEVKRSNIMENSVILGTAHYVLEQYLAQI